MRYTQFCTTEDLGDSIRYTGPCVVTRRPYSVVVLKSGILSYEMGAFIQDAFPDLSADDREFLMSGMSPAGWKITFGEENE